MISTSERFVQLANGIINSPDSRERIGLAKDLADPLGTLLMMPVPVLEQLLAKLQLDYIDMQKPLMNPNHPLVILSNLMLPNSLANAKYTIGVLLVWVKVRKQFVKELQAFGLPKEGIPE